VVIGSFFGVGQRDPQIDRVEVELLLVDQEVPAATWSATSPRRRDGP
jgi:hypothetical protein